MSLSGRSPAEPGKVIDNGLVESYLDIDLPDTSAEALRKRLVNVIAARPDRATWSSALAVLGVAENCPWGYQWA